MLFSDHRTKVSSQRGGFGIHMELLFHHTDFEEIIGSLDRTQVLLVSPNHRPRKECKPPDLLD